MSGATGGALGTPVGLIALGGGLVLMFSAYRNLSPIQLVTNTLTGVPNPKAGAVATAPAPAPAKPKQGGSSSGSGLAPGGGSAGGGGGGGGGGSWGSGADGIDHNNTGAMNAWITANPGAWPDPGKGASDFWNAMAKRAADSRGVRMVGNP